MDHFSLERACEDCSTEISQSAAVAGLMSTCSICLKIWNCLNKFSPQQGELLGHFQELLSSGCPGHMPLIQELQERCGRHHMRDIAIYVYSGSQWGTASLLPLTGSREWSISIAEDLSVSGHPGIVRVLSPDWMDVEAATKWKQQCLSEHGAVCNDPMGLAPERPAWLIDVWKDCIVQGKDCRSFVALSYVWGKHSWLRVDADTLPLLQKPGALSDIPGVATKLAPIVRHAMHLTSVLEERYLWIDSLCIVQGVNNVYEELNRMGNFYASAVVTIIAADGDSKSGLCGLEGVSEPRKLIQRLVPFGHERLLVDEGSIYTDGPRPEYPNGPESEYWHRGWTYQEHMMSKRRLVVDAKKLHWECNHHGGHEDLVSLVRWRPKTLGKIERGFPDMSSLAAIMYEYNHREFTFEEDALPGISGLLSAWSRTFTGGFLCGLPEMFFHRSLGWMPRRTYTDLRRRTPSGEVLTNRAKDTSLAILPSWSWLGWKGEVKLSGLSQSEGLCQPEAVSLNDLPGVSPNRWNIEETTPTTTWYTSNEAHGGALRRIGSSWYENRDKLYKDLLRPLPHGWSRFKLESRETESDYSVGERQHLFPPGCGKDLFEHVKLPGVHWYYPFPVMDFANAPQYMPEQTQYLFCRTQRTRLFASRVLDVNDWVLKRNVLLLHVKPHGEKAGELQAHNDELVEGLLPSVEAGLDTAKGDSHTGAYVELVIIYESCINEAERIRSDAGDDWGKSFTGNIITHHRYAVLWVEWQEGIAYRRGIGHVDKASWELSGPEEIDLVLG